jgi:hypothetical protein
MRETGSNERDALIYVLVMLLALAIILSFWDVNTRLDAAEAQIRQIQDQVGSM